jgi:hypothetical protein
MKTKDREMMRLGELVGSDGGPGIANAQVRLESPRIVAKAVLHLLRSRRHTLALGPATIATPEPMERKT